jgi:hypothetical protein
MSTESRLRKLEKTDTAPSSTADYSSPEYLAERQRELEVLFDEVFLGINHPEHVSKLSPEESARLEDLYYKAFPQEARKDTEGK